MQWTKLSKYTNMPDAILVIGTISAYFHKNSNKNTSNFMIIPVLVDRIPLPPAINKQL